MNTLKRITAITFATLTGLALAGLALAGLTWAAGALVHRLLPLLLGCFLLAA